LKQTQKISFDLIFKLSESPKYMKMAEKVPRQEEIEIHPGAYLKICIFLNTYLQ